MNPENIRHCGDASTFTVQGLRDALTKAESAVTEPSPPADEFIIQLEVTMADQPGGLHDHQLTHGMEA